MQPVSLELDQTLKVFVYGDPGSGKTTLCGSLMDDPRTSPCLYLVCGGNPQSLRRRKNPPTFIKVDASDDLTTICDWLRKGQPAEHKFTDFCKNYKIVLPSKPFKSLAFDGVTEYQRIIFDEINGNTGRLPGEKLASPRSQQEWGQLLGRMVVAARFLYGLPLTVVITSLEKYRQDAMTGVLSYEPLLQGDSRAEVPGYSLLTLRLVRQSKMDPSTKSEVGRDAYSVAYVDQVGRFLAKEQYGTYEGGPFPKYFDNPTIPEIMNVIYGAHSA